MLSRLLPGRSCPDRWCRWRPAAVGQHPVPDLRHQEPGAFHRMGGQAQGGQRSRLQYDPLHPLAGKPLEHLILGGAVVLGYKS